MISKACGNPKFTIVFFVSCLFVVLFITHFGFEDMILVLVFPVPGHCLLSIPGHCLLSIPGHCLLYIPGHCLLSIPGHCLLSIPGHCLRSIPGLCLLSTSIC